MLLSRILEAFEVVSVFEEQRKVLFLVAVFSHGVLHSAPTENIMSGLSYGCDYGL